VNRVLTWLLAVPVGVVLVALAVANRRPIVLSLDPFRPDAPAFSVTAPLFLLVFGALILGVLLGGVTVWWRQGVHRRVARARRREVDRLTAENDRLAADLARATGAAETLPGLDAPGRRAA
jgi:uncharacterized integral membrane protein